MTVVVLDRGVGGHHHKLKKESEYMQVSPSPICTYMCNGARVILTAAALSVQELDDRTKGSRLPVWVETEIVRYSDATSELERMQDFRAAVEWQVRQLEKLEMEAEEWGDLYFAGRRERIQQAYELQLRALSNLPPQTVPMESVVNF
jgi:hypothetical protein